MARAYGEGHGNMITIEHTVLCKPELRQDDVISFRPLCIPTALWAGVCAVKREGEEVQDMRQEALHAFFQNSNTSIKSTMCSRLINIFILISHIPKCNNCCNDKVFSYKFTYSYTHAEPHASHWPRSKFMVSLGLVMCAGVVG